MKKSIIREIFYGNRGHCEAIKGSGEYRELLNRSAELSKKLTEGLNEGQIELFNQICTLQADMEAEVALSHFTEGVKIGALVDRECLEG